jgi:hypothetical protein
MGVFAVVILVLIGTLVLRWLTTEFTFRYPVFSSVSLAVGIALHLAIALSAVGLVVPNSGSLFVFGLLWGLVFGATILLAMISMSWEN